MTFQIGFLNRCSDGCNCQNKEGIKIKEKVCQLFSGTFARPDLFPRFLRPVPTDCPGYRNSSHSFPAREIFISTRAYFDSCSLCAVSDSSLQKSRAILKVLPAKKVMPSFAYCSLFAQIGFPTGSFYHCNHNAGNSLHNVIGAFNLGSLRFPTRRLRQRKKFAYLMNKNKSFARPSRAFFYLCTFLSRSRQICDVK